MLVVRTSEGRADPICQLVSAQRTVGFDHPTLAVNPLGLYGVEPWALFGQQAADDPHPGFATALFDLPVMSGHPLSNLFGDVPGGVVPDQHPNLLARRLELLAAPPKEPRGYRAHGTTVHEAHPHLLKLGHIKPVAGDGLGIGVVLGDRLFDEAHRRFARIAPAVEGRPRQAAEPSLVQKSYRPLGMSRRQANQSVASEASLFFLRTRGRGWLSTAWPAPSALRGAPEWPGWSPRSLAASSSPPRSSLRQRDPTSTGSYPFRIHGDPDETSPAKPRPPPDRRPDERCVGGAIPAGVPL